MTTSAADVRVPAPADLTDDEAVALLAGDALWSTPGVDRLGVPPLVMTDGPSGARGQSMTSGTSVCFPCGTALGATWDPALVERVGAALGAEARRVGADVLLAPTVNLHRSPLAGRNFECFSEDPLLTGRLAAAYVRGVQSRGTAACVKHLVANDSEHERMTISAEVPEPALRELYLEPFRAALLDAGAWAVMSAYNRLGGTHCSEHEQLLTGVLRDEWGWDGVVVSDWFGTHSAVESLRAGLDVEMPGPPAHRGGPLAEARASGAVTRELVDRSVARLLALRERVSAARLTAPAAVEDPVAVAREAGTRAAVLLRNEGVLPFDLPTLRRVALLGPEAETGQVQGGGSAQVNPTDVVAPGAGLRAALPGDVELVVERGCTISETAPALSATLLRAPDGAPGGLLELYQGSRPTAVPVLNEVVPRAHALWLGSPGGGLAPGDFSARLTADLVPTETGTHVLSLSAAGSGRVVLDGRTVLEIADPETGGAFFGLGSAEHRVEVPLRAGAAHRIEVAFTAPPGVPLAGLTVGLLPPEPPDLLDRAVAAAASADVAVVLVGLNADWESEGHDRASMRLPGRQDELVQRVAAANPHTVVVVNAGSAVEMPWLDEVEAVLQLWYPGQALGDCLAAVLVGAASPAGRLPTTFYRRVEDSPSWPHYPGSDGRVTYGEGLHVGHRAPVAEGAPPLFPFGFGLTYTTFRHGPAVLTATAEGWTVDVPVTNTGDRPGREVVQVYLAEPGGHADRPVRQLVGFAAVEPPPAGTATASIAIERSALRAWVDGCWRPLSGSVELRVGAHADDVANRLVLQLDSDV